MGPQGRINGGKYMKIVMLERLSVGSDIDVSCFDELGEVVAYDNTVSVEEVA